MADMMIFPDTVEEFMKQYKMVDTEHVYSNGIEYVPIFRMMQWFEHNPERKTGRWIEVKDSDNSISGKCSECGWEAHMYEDDVFGMDYCPNCGARLLI